MNDTFQSAGAVASNVVNRWAWWRAALSGNFGPIHSEPQQGYYRVRGKDGQWEPVAIWVDEGGAWLAYRSGREVRDVEQLWTYACRFPIEHAVYEKAMVGGGFDDEPPAPIGDNSGDIDPFEALRIEYLGEKEQAEEFMKQPVKTQAQADKVAIWSKRLTTIKTKAEGLHKVEKQPHLDAGRAVDDKWRDLKSEPDELAKQLKAHIKPFLQEQIRAEEDRQRKAREEADRIRREADEARIAAEKAMAKKVADGISDAAAIQEHNNRMAEAERQARAAEQEAEARKVNAGRTGARVSMRTVKVGVVTDYAKAAAALVGMRHKDLIEIIDKLAQRAATAGMPFDGMEIKEEERVV
ncbi:hypothetical protein NKI61_19770 [Mesorhizobium sp. M0514]|uniref:hypothetical protein n=1 Tax=Mesorhizobium sp. M0514 TaxID=2956955 RepID=UPI0033352109